MGNADLGQPGVTPQVIDTINVGGAIKFKTNNFIIQIKKYMCLLA